MNEENITDGALSGDAQLTASDATAAVGNETSGDVASMTLSELNQHLNKNFPTKESALKSIADTFSYVGKKKEDIAKELQANDGLSKVSGELEAIRKDMFYKDNPEYASYRNLIEKVGGNPAEVVNLPEFKDVFTKASGFDTTQKLKTVLDSNPRLASSRDALSRAQDLQKSGGSQDEVEALIGNAVLDAFGK